jgi:hypothetical protein
MHGRLSAQDKAAGYIEPHTTIVAKLTVALVFHFTQTAGASQCQREHGSRKAYGLSGINAARRVDRPAELSGARPVKTSVGQK